MKIFITLVSSIFFLFGFSFTGKCLPQIEEITSGTAETLCPDPSTLEITAGNKTVINYSSFDILENETVRITLPSSQDEILNRVISGSSTTILGSLFCNGTLFLINTAGISFGPQAIVDVSGLIASTRDITDSDFLDSNYVFEKGSSEYIDRLLLNEGNIFIRDAGFGVFIAGAVENRGLISAELGTVALISGDKVEVSFYGNDLISVAIDKSAASGVYDSEGSSVLSALENTGRIEADGGEVLIKADTLPGLFKKTVNLEGYLQADAVEEKDGVISIVSSSDIDSEAVVDADKIDVRAQGDICFSKGAVNAGKGGITVHSDQTIYASTDFSSEGDVYFYSDYDSDGKGDFYQQAGIIDAQEEASVFIDCQNKMALGKIQAEQGAIRISTEQEPVAVLGRPEYVRTQGTMSIVSTEHTSEFNIINTAENDRLLYNHQDGVVLKAEKTTIAENGSTDLYGNIEFYNFNLIQPGKEVRFEPEKTYTFKGSTFIQGSGYDVIRLISQEKEKQWYISIPDDDYLITLSAIEDSCNTGDKTLISEPSINLGNNTNWYIDPFWVGAGVDNNWSTDANWWPAAVPGVADAVTFDGTDHGAPGAIPNKDAAVDAGFAGTIDTLDIDGYAGTITLDSGLTVNGAFSINTGSINTNGQDFNVGSFTQTGGIFTAGASAITCSGNLSLTAGTFNADSSVITMDVTNGDSLLTADGYTLNTVEFYSDSAAAQRTVTLGGGTISFSDDFYINAANTQDLVVDASANNPDLNISSSLDFTGAGAGTESINMGNGTWTVTSTVDFTDGTVNAGNSLLRKTGSYETIRGNGQTLWDLWIDGTTSLSNSDLYVDNSLIVDTYLYINSSVTLRLNNGAVSSFIGNANVMNPGLLEFVDSACSNITLTGRIKTKVRFTADTGDIIIPELTLYGPVEFYNSGAADRIVTLGTGAGQSLTLGSVFLSAEGNGNMTMDADTWDPDITVYGDLDFTGTGAGTETLSLGDGAWTVGGNIDFTDGTVVPGTGVIYMDASSWDNLGLGTSYHPQAVCVYDGKLIVGGSFTQAGGMAISRIAQWDGANWSALGAGMGNYVADLIIYNGELVAGGYFGNCIASWDGSNWSGFGSGMAGGAVFALAEYNGNLIAGGGFTTAGGIPVNYIAQWDGANWSALGSGMNFWVDSLAVYNGDLYAGGGFTTAGGNTVNHIARWNGSEWSAIGTGMAGGSTGVESLIVYDNKLIAGGIFTSVNGMAANCIAAWDGANWSTLGSGVSSIVQGLLVDGANLIAAGNFGTAGGQRANYIAQWDGANWSPLGSGFDREVYGICSYNGGIAAVGRFTRAGIEANYVAVLDHESLLTFDNEALNQLVITNSTDFDRTVALTDTLSLNSDLVIDCQGEGDIYFNADIYDPDLNINGDFDFTGAGTGSRIVNMGSGTWTVAGSVDLTDSTINATASELIMSGSYENITGYNQTLYDFSTIGGASYLTGSDLYIDHTLNTRFLRLSQGTTLHLNDGASTSIVSEISEFGTLDFIDSAGGNLAAGGNISCRTRFTAQNSDAVVSQRSYSGPVEFINTGSTDRKVVLGTAGGQSISFASIYLKADGTGNLNVDASVWDPDIAVKGNIDFTGTGSGTESISLGSGAWNIGGSIDLSGGALDSGTSSVSLDASAWSALGSGMNNTVRALVSYNGNLIAGGEFTTAGGTGATHIAQWNGTSWSGLGTGMNSPVTSLYVYGGDLIAGGSFTMAGGIAALRVASWDGTNWSALGSGTNNIVWSLNSYAGNLIAGGEFTTAGGAGANHIASWDGANWSALGTGMDNDVLALAVFGGELIAAGKFGTAGGGAASRIASWNGANWSPLGTGTAGGSNYINDLEVYNGELYAGGVFGFAGGVAVNDIASWDGSNWSTVGSGLSGPAYALTTYDNRLIAGGYFLAAGGNEANYIAAWDGANWAQVGSGTNRAVRTLCAYGNQLIAGGYFDTAGLDAARIAATVDTVSIKLNSQSFYDLTLSNDSIYARTFILESDLTVNNDLYLAAENINDLIIDSVSYNPGVYITGSFDFSGAGAGTEIINAGSSTWTVSGDADLRDGTFTCNTSSFVLNGNDQTVYGSTSFFDFTKIGGNRTLYFEEGSTQTITGTLTLQGTSFLSLRSTTDTVQWNIDPQGTVDIRYVDVMDSVNINADPIIAYDSIDSLNNINWSFMSSTSDEPDINDTDLEPDIPESEDVFDTPETPGFDTDTPDDNIDLPGEDNAAEQNDSAIDAPAPDRDNDSSLGSNKEDGFDYSLIWEDRGKKKRYYKKAKYKTTVILYEGKVIMDPYDEEGRKKDQRKVLMPGQSTSQKGEIK